MLSPREVLDKEFLEARCMLVEVAAILDRYDRAVEQSEGPPEGDERLEKLYDSLKLLADRQTGSNRSEQMLLLHSDPVEV